MILALRGRSSDPNAQQAIFDAVMCKAYGCRPSELEEEDAETLALHFAIYVEMMKKNPFVS